MEKNCFWCGNKKVFGHLGRQICERCFNRLIEKRVKKGLGRAFKKGDRVLVVGELAVYFVERIMENFPIKIIKKKSMPKDVSGFDKVVLEETMDDEVVNFLSSFLSKDFKFKKDKKTIRMLAVISDDEAEKFARIKRINFKPREKDQKINSFLRKLSKEHPEIKYNLLRNVKEMKKILN